MTRLALLTVLASVALVHGGAAPFLELYTQTDSGGAMFSISGPHHDFSTEGFNDVTRSLCGVGLWFLYEDKDYTDHSKFVVTFTSPTYGCTNLDSSLWDRISSARFPGLDDIDYPTLTLYQHGRQCGSERLILRDTDALPDFNDKASSFAVTGNSSWTIYVDSGFTGGAACLTPSGEDGFFYGTWNSDELGFSNDEVSSVRKGCHTDRVFHYGSHSLLKK